uniref:EGF-like domain-containing protein n=1 Tax=Amphimedon queenslandica TaxID=400682 RepID=A0A1X7SW10_AMPQE
MVKTVTSQGNTNITIYCNGATNTTRYSTNGAIGIYQYSITEYCYVEANKPIFVVLFPHSYYYYTAMVWIPPMEQYLQEVNFDFYRSSRYSKFVITASVEGFSPTAILHNGLATANWTAVYDFKRNIVAYGTEIEINRYFSNHSLSHTGNNGKLSVQVQGYFYSHIIYGWPALVSLEQNMTCICNFIHSNGMCDANNLCQCFDGWTGDQCDEDINECETNDHNCTQTCSNTVGSYTCSCRAGYKDNGYGNCTDIDECSMGTSGCQQLCFNTNGSYYCQCNTGYRLMNDNSSCDDINECIEDPGICPLRSNCINTLGSYQCNCIDGYQMNNTGMCIDIDECVTGTHSCQHRCINTEGSYNCSCYDGFMKRFKIFCFDINECETVDHNCTQTCSNTVGSYTCSCRAGYKDNGYGNCTGKTVRV